MNDTAKLGLPLLAAAQAQKHVTVNAALTRLDALTAPAALTRGLTAPPSDAADGDLHLVGAGATGGWAGRDGDLAFCDAGVWRFGRARAGRRLWIVEEGVEVVHDGAGWVEASGHAVDGAGTALRTITLDHAIAPGAENVTAPVIPDKAIVLGVTARVTAPLTGAGLTGWRLGVPGAPDRYGTGYGAEQNAWAQGVTGQPVAYYGATPLLLTAEDGLFEAGAVRLAVHLFALTPPRAV
jgi:hypothetical protein